MYQIDNSTAAAIIPASTAVGAVGFFTDGNPATGVPATIMPAEFMNMLMMEVLNVLSAAGVTPSKSNFTQLVTAIRAVNKQSTILIDTGVANAYAAANTPALLTLPATGYSQRVNIANVNTGASTYAPDGLAAKPVYGLGLQPLQGGEMPAGVVVLMYLVQAGVNGGNGAWIIIESLGGASQVAPATKSQHAVQFGQVSGVVGQTRNLKMSVAAASATATLTADEIVVETALGGLRYCLASFNKTINLATTGAGGMDTGAAPVSGFVALYAIYNPATGASALLAANATAAIAPEAYGGANMPAGYTASALLTVVPTNASSQFVAVYVADRQIFVVSVSILTTTTQSGSPVSFSVAGAVPKNARSCRGNIQVVSSVSGTTIAAAFMGSTAFIGSSGINTNNTAVNGGLNSPFTDVPIITAQTLFYTGTTTAGTMTLSGTITCYTI